MSATDQLRAEVHAIIDKLGHDDLRVFRYQGRRMIDIGYPKYGPLDLSTDRRPWDEEMAQETADRMFYESCREIAKADRELERKQRRLAERHDEAFAHVSSAMRASFALDDHGVHEVLLPFEGEGKAS